LSCFGDLDLSRTCVNCGKKADDTPSLPHHLPQRTVLNNKYLVQKALGEGGFGITYLAWDLSQGIKTAIKEYYPSGYVNRVPKSNQVIINSKQNQAASNRGLKRFIDEAKVLAKIKNLPGIVSVKDFFSANGTAYIVMEFLDGISLKKFMQRKGGRITMDEVITILRPVMESLCSVHDLGLIHRDISPDNILITKYNEVKLIDFGAAKQSNLDGKSLSIVLKQGFAPEEQYRTHGEQGPWTDVYALGVTMYYCITGKLPPESIQRMYKDTIVKPSEYSVQISPLQEAALMKSLAVFAKNRYQDVKQLIAGLFGNKKPITAPLSNQTPQKEAKAFTPSPAPAPYFRPIPVPQNPPQLNTDKTNKKTDETPVPKTVDERKKAIAENRRKQQEKHGK
jgi:serine/threonine protein kinase